MEKLASYTKRLDFSLALQLAAPHTWPAAIIPVLIAYCASMHMQGSASLLCAFVLLAISILLQSSVNAINDYFDFIKGTDTDDDNVEADDAVLIYNDINPSSVRNLSIALIVSAFILGIYIIYIAGIVPLLIALIGAAVIFLYSGGKTPISYLPIGEAVSGFVMGGLITFASFYALTRQADWFVFVLAIPAIIGIALIMLSNNISDIEKDAEAKRRTLCVLLGCKRAAVLYRTLLALWMLSVLAISLACFIQGIFIVIVGLIIAYPTFMRLFTAPFVPEGRIALMGHILQANIILNGFYCASMLL